MKRISLTILVVLILGTVTPVIAQQWKVVGVLISDVSTGESMIMIDAEQPVQEGRKILIESRDGAIREEHEVAHVYDHHVLLRDHIVGDFLSGSKIYQ